LTFRALSRNHRSWCSVYFVFIIQSDSRFEFGFFVEKPVLVANVGTCFADFPCLVYVLQVVFECWGPVAELGIFVLLCVLFLRCIWVLFSGGEDSRVWWIFLS
jgi:hypothetical protein